MSFPRTQTSGFTLIELLIVITITVILLGATGMYLADFQTERRVTLEASQLTAMLKTAQEKAIGQQEDSRWGVYIVNPASGQGTYALYMVDEGLLPATGPDAPGTVSELHTLSSGVSFTTPSGGTVSNIIFTRGTGLPVSPTTAVLTTTQSSPTTLTVYVNANGQIEYR